MKASLFFASTRLALAGIGCGGEDGADSVNTGRSAIVDRDGGTGLACRDLFETQIFAWDEASPLGFSADGVLAALGAEQSGRLTYEDGTATPLRLGLQRGIGVIEFRADDAAPLPVELPPDTIINDTWCRNGFWLPVTLSFDTEDGAFSEDWQLALLVSSRTHAGGDGLAIDLDALVGNYTPPDADQYDDADVQITVDLQPDHWSGTLIVVTTTTISTGPDGIAMAGFSPVGTF
jgi:hypothetical protein